MQPLSDLQPDELEQRVKAIDWYHTIDLGNGLVTNGASTLSIDTAYFPDFEGRRVLDIGAWDGKYSFLAEQSGAVEVRAVDHYAWEVDFDLRNEWWAAKWSRGEYPDPSKAWDECRSPDRAGMQGFNLAHACLKSRVIPHVANFMTMDLEELEGEFDVVLFLGVLYHVDDPLNALRRIWQMTKEGGIAVVESLAIEFRDLPNDMSAVQFAPGATGYDDFSVTWIPTEAALFAMLKSAGFKQISRVSVEPPVLAPTRKSTIGRAWNAFNRWRGSTNSSEQYRIVLHAVK